MYQNYRKIYQNYRKIYQIEEKYTKLQKNRGNVHKTDQHLSLKGTPKFTQIGILGFKIYHLAALSQTRKQKKMKLATVI
jgi:hypothetical protein